LQSLPANANQINFDKTGTNLNSTQTENAIKEVNTKVNTNTTDINQLKSGYNKRAETPSFLLLTFQRRAHVRCARNFHYTTGLAILSSGFCEKNSQSFILKLVQFFIKKLLTPEK